MVFDRRIARAWGAQTGGLWRVYLFFDFEMKMMKRDGGLVPDGCQPFGLLGAAAEEGCGGSEPGGFIEEAHFKDAPACASGTHMTGGDDVVFVI